MTDEVQLVSCLMNDLGSLFLCLILIRWICNRIGPSNLLRNESSNVPLSSTLTNDTAIEESSFPQLSSPPPQGDDE